MMDALPKGYTGGTHRLIPPEETWRQITPHFAATGITRCADVTGLDHLGIPVSCAIRPNGRLLQVSNGKGLRQVDANISACMEAIELYHAEHPACQFKRSSFNAMKAAGRPVIRPDRVAELRRQVHWSNDYVLDWVEAKELVSKARVWVPAAAAYWCTPFLFNWSTNGLASGNHLVEATLHALYELIERDTISTLSVAGRVTFSPKHCRFIDMKTVPNGPVKKLSDQLSAEEIKLVLIWVWNKISVPTFMAVLLDRKPFALSSTVNLGYGAHLSPMVAAVRAITEAAQSRLTFIHGAREDMTPSAYQESHDDVYRFFDGIKARARWTTLRDGASADLFADYNRVVRLLARAGHKRIFRVNMTRPDFNIPVVKVLVPGMKVDQNFF